MIFPRRLPQPLGVVGISVLDFQGPLYRALYRALFWALFSLCGLPYFPFVFLLFSLCGLPIRCSFVGCQSVASFGFMAIHALGQFVSPIRCFFTKPLMPELFIIRPGLVKHRPRPDQTSPPQISRNRSNGRLNSTQKQAKMAKNRVNR